LRSPNSHQRDVTKGLSLNELACPSGTTSNENEVPSRSCNCVLVTANALVAKHRRMIYFLLSVAAFLQRAELPPCPADERFDSDSGKRCKASDVCGFFCNRRFANLAFLKTTKTPSNTGQGRRHRLTHVHRATLPALKDCPGTF
jgi:hypothetical protein